jgi:hypothetical protein
MCGGDSEPCFGNGAYVVINVQATYGVTITSLTMVVHTPTATCVAQCQRCSDQYKIYDSETLMGLSTNSTFQGPQSLVSPLVRSYGTEIPMLKVKT